MLERTGDGFELGKRASRILNYVKYKDSYWWIIATSPVTTLRLETFADGKLQSGRKWLLEDEMTDTEIVLTALKAALTFEEHEVREAFRYKGARIFGPHLDLDQMQEFARKKANLSLRN